MHEVRPTQAEAFCRQTHYIRKKSTIQARGSSCIARGRRSPDSGAIQGTTAAAAAVGQPARETLHSFAEEAGRFPANRHFFVAVKGLRRSVVETEITLDSPNRPDFRDYF
jgi:hypothetical protein